MGDAWDNLDAPRARPETPSASAPAPSSSSSSLPTSPSTGLWRHSGQAHGEEASKCRIIAFIVAVLCGYGMAMLVNGAASRLLTPRFVVSPGASPLTGTKLVVVGADPVFLLSTFRILATLCLLAAMFVVGDIPSELKAARTRALSCVWVGRGSTAPPHPPPLAIPSPTSSSTSTTGQEEDWAASPPPTPVAVGEPLKSKSSSSSSSSSSGLTPALIAVPVAIGATNALGYLPYMVLCNMDGVALWSALVGLYVVIPVSYGVFVRGEARTRKKVIGIAACVISGILLGLPAGGEGGDGSAADAAAAEGEGGSPGWVKLVLFIATIGIWGACDGMVAFVGRDLHQFYVAAFTAVGFGLSALVASWVAFIATATAGTGPFGGAVAGNATAPTAGGSPSHTPTDSVGDGGAAGYALLFAAQAAGICAWYASVRLGQMSEASAFLPITALYTLLTSVGGVTLLGESLPSMGWAGIALAAVGMLLIATA